MDREKLEEIESEFIVEDLTVEKLADEIWEEGPFESFADMLTSFPSYSRKEIGEALDYILKKEKEKVKEG